MPGNRLWCFQEFRSPRCASIISCFRIRLVSCRKITRKLTRVMSGFVNTCSTASPSMSKADDNLSNSDRPLIKQSFYQNNNIVSTEKRGILKSNSNMSGDDNIIDSNRKRYCLWMLTFVLAAVGLCNLLLSITIIAVLRVSQGMEAMEVIPDENLIKFYGRTDLDKVCLQAGVCQGYGDEPMELSGDDAGVQINLKNRRDKLTSSIHVLTNGTTISQVESFEIKDPQTGSSYFSTDFPNFGLPSGVRKIDIDIAVTHRITSPINESLTIKSDGQISMIGGEGNRMEGKEIVWTADKDIFLKSLNGNIILSAKEGISIDIKSIPIVSSSILNPVESGQYKVCVCMPQGKLFRVPVPPGTSTHVNCARVSMTPENNPCI